MRNPNESPVFIVGASRSGTALLQSILSNHPSLHISGETHYFDDLRVTMAGREQDPLSAQDARRCEDYFLALAHRPYGHGGDPKRSRIDRTRLRAVANRVGLGADAYFEGFCRLNAETAGKVHWGEKTPRHVFRIAEIIQRYPAARIICMVRDPRAVVVSYRDGRAGGGHPGFEGDPDHRQALKCDQRRLRKSYNILVLSLLWRATVQAAVLARKRFGADRVYIQQFEELVGDPTVATERLAAWLSLEYWPSMLDVPMHNSSFSTFNERAGVSQEPARRWREKLSDTEIGVTQACCGSLMKKTGYTREPVKIPIFALAWHWIALPAVTLRIVRVNRGRMVDIPDYIWRRLRLAIGYRSQAGKSVQSR